MTVIDFPRPVTTHATHTVVFLRTSSTARLPVYEELAAKGYNLVMIHPSVSFDFSHAFSHWIECETNDVDQVEAALRSAMKVHGFTPDAIISIDEYGVYPAACLAERFGKRPLPLPPAGLRVTTVKSAFRDWCAEYNIGSPKNAKLGSPNDPIAAAVADLKFPVVVKPSPGAGSMLTKRCDTIDELEACVPGMWLELRDHPALIHLEALGTKVHLLVEEYVGGQEVDVDCIVENGNVRFCAISDNFETKPPYFQEQGGLTPSALGPQEQQALRDLLHDFVSSHGQGLHGVLHFEAKYDFDRQKAFVIEVNVRPGSAETHTMISTVYGVSLGEALVRLSLDLPLDDMKLDSATPRGFCASVNIYPEVEGVVAAVELQHSTDVVAFSPIAPGSCVAPAPKTFTMIAWLVARGSTAAAAVESMRKATKSVHVVVREACVLFADEVENSSLAF